jgi:hypothetical protein
MRCLASASSIDGRIGCMNMHGCLPCEHTDLPLSASFAREQG